MARIVTVTPVTEEEGARLAHRPGAQPWVDDVLASEVRAKIGELRGSEAPEIALARVGESEWLAYAMDDAPVGDSGMFLVTVRDPSQFGAFP